MREPTDFQVRRDDLRQTRFTALDAAQDAPLAAGEVLVKVDRFAFTANNITYAVFGDGMNYWDFFPAPDGWGRVPVWGFGDVARSNAEGVAAGERLYGYFPMSSWVKLTPQRVAPHGFADGAAHRAHLHPVYNRYQRLAADPAHRREDEPAHMLLRPLFSTSYLIDDFLAEAGFFGARQVVLTSASSKTALALAHQLHALRAGQVDVVGLTSPANRAFCAGLGVYDRVLAYDEVETLDAAMPAVSVDMAGNGDVLRRIHEHFGPALRHSCLVGGTHWEARRGVGELPGPAPELFFAPAQMKKRADEWGPAEFEARMASAWRDFMLAAKGWIRVHDERGAEAVERSYRETLEGRVDPATGQILSLND